MSIHALQARLEEISSEIVLQERLLRQLRREKTLAQRRLNEAVDPVARLPLEFSSEIFLQCIAPFPGQKPAGDRAPLLLMNICSTWTAIALSTPRLWSAVVIDFNRPEALRQLLPTWLQRAGKHPLSISLRGIFRIHHIPPIVWLYHEQLKELEIAHEEPDNPSHNSEDDDTDILDIFGDVTPEPLPLLERLTVHNEGNLRGFLTVQIFQLLCLAPKLVHYMFSNSFLYHDDFSIPSKKPILSILRTLTFGDRDYRDAEPGCDEGILSCVVFPALTELVVGTDGRGHNILAFLKQQSTPALQSLALGMRECAAAPDSIELHKSLHLVPSLVRFEMWYPKAHHLVPFCATLADSPSFLPNLRVLIIYLFMSTIIDSNSCWEPLLRALSARRIELRIVRFDATKPPEDILAAFVELVAHGANISIRSDQSECI